MKRFPIHIWTKAAKDWVHRKGHKFFLMVCSDIKNTLKFAYFRMFTFFTDISHIVKPKIIIWEFCGLI